MRKLEISDAEVMQVSIVLRLVFLPPYSPQFAPIERLWKLARRLATHNRYFATLAELIAPSPSASGAGANRIRCYAGYAHYL